MAEHEGLVVGAVAQVERHDDEAARRRRQIDGRPESPVRQDDGDAVTGIQRGTPQRRGETLDPPGDRLPGMLAPCRIGRIELAVSDGGRAAVDALGQQAEQCSRFRGSDQIGCPRAMRHLEHERSLHRLVYDTRAP